MSERHSTINRMCIRNTNNENEIMRERKKKKEKDKVRWKNVEWE